MTNLTVQLLAELIDEQCKPTPIRQLPTKKRRRYQSDAVRSARHKVDAALESGIVLPIRQHIRDALTDAAMHLIRNGGVGSDAIYQVLETVFGAEADAVFAKIEAGKIEPKFFKSP